MWTKRMDFALWPVGQGLFSQLDIWVGGTSHRIVYDCGTFCSHAQMGTSALLPAANRGVDLLVVSHFHWDHISRIPQLLSCAGSIREVWIPYLSPEQRALCAFATAMGGIAAQGDETHLAEVTGLASAGREWFESRGCLVHEIGGGQPPGEDIRPDDEPPPEGPRDSDPDRHREWDGDDHDAYPPTQLRLDPPRRLSGALRSGSSFAAFYSRLNATSHAKHSEAPVRLLTWVRPIGASLTRTLMADLHKWLAPIAPSLKLGNLVDKSTARVNTGALLSIVEAVRQKASRTAIGDIYEKLNHDLNTSSLFLLAQPTCRRSEYRFSMSLKHHDYFGVESLEPGPAVLWTGDAPATLLEELLHDMLVPLREPISAVAVHQVPHHGSASSMCSSWLREVGSRWNRRNCPMSVISSGRINHFRHPSPEVVWRFCSKVVCEGSAALEASWAWR